MSDTTPVTALDILKAAREYAADPDHIVKNPLSVYEDENGSPHGNEANSARGCVLGIIGIAAHRLGASTLIKGEPGWDALDAADKACPNFERAVTGGPTAIGAVYDRAIAALEETS